MELASIYLNETKLDQNNKFTINFLTTESNFNVFFNRNTVCYITNLDLNLVLDDETITHHQKVIELSKLSNELITKSFIGTKFNTVSLLNFYSLYIKFVHKLYLNKDIVDAFSYKYEFLDTSDNKIKKCKIYDPYQHLKVGMQFECNDISTYKVNINGNKLIQKLEYNNEKLETGWWSKYINSIIMTNGTDILIKKPLYNKLFHIFKDINIKIPAKELMYQYYFNIDLVNHRVICSENKYNTLSYTEKQEVVFIVLKNKKIRALKNRTFWIPTSSIRGDLK